MAPPTADRGPAPGPRRSWTATARRRDAASRPGCAAAETTAAPPTLPGALRPASAEEALAALEDEPRQPLLLDYAGVALYELGAREAAAAAVRRAAAELDPELPHVAANLAGARARRGVAARHRCRQRCGDRLPGLESGGRRLAAAAGPADGLALSLCMIVRDEEEMLPRCLAGGARRGRRDRRRRHRLARRHGRDRPLLRRHG